MRTYYRGHDALVTAEHLVWRTSPSRTFPVGELRDIVIVRGDVDPLGSASIRVAGGAAVAVAASWPLLDSIAAYVIAALAVAVPGTVSAVCWRTRPRYWELRATYRGDDVLLFASSDVTAFNQIGRALMRATEDTEPPVSRYGLAGG